MKIYISGPITGHKDAGWKFKTEEERLKKSGHKVVNPFELFKTVDDMFDHATILKACLALLPGCECIYMMNGWQESKGAQRELEEAERLGLAVWYGGDQGGKA